MELLALAPSASGEVLEPFANFFESGILQLGRVLKGPRPRNEVAVGSVTATRTRTSPTSPRRRQAARRQRATAGPPRREVGHGLSLPVHLSSSAVETSGKPAAAFVLASLPASPLQYTSTGPTALQIQLLSDTVRHIFAGTAARTMSQIFIHPIDTIKTRLQVNKLSAPHKLLDWRAHSEHSRFRVCIGRKQILSLQNWLVKGPSDLYRGLSAAIVGTIPVAMLYFGSYEASKSILEAQGASGSVAHLTSASVGAVVSAFVRVPTDTLKHRTQAYIIPGSLQGARSIVAREGVAGLYHGLLPTLLRDVPELALQFSLYEALRHSIEDHRKVKKLQTWEHLVLGGLSGAAAASVTMPLDVAKTALQTGASRDITGLLRGILHEKGARGLFAGMGPRVTQIALQGAVFFTLFEAWKAQLKQVRVDGDKLMAPKLWRKRRGHVWKRQFVIQ